MQKMKFPLQKMIDICRTGYLKNPSDQVIEILALHDYRARKGFKGAVPLSVIREIKAGLVRDHGISEDMFRPMATRLSDMGSRADVIAHSSDEKAGGQRVRGELIILRPQPGKILRMAGKDYRMPPLGTMNFMVEDADELDVKGVIVVENWVAFRDFERLNFEVPVCWRDYLLVFRGMPGLANPGASKRFLERLKRPVIVFPDFDPAGLVLAMATPGYAGILWPGEDRLRAMLNAGMGNKNRYDDQIGSCRQRLESSDGTIRLVWDILEEKGKGIMQESFLRNYPKEG